MHVQCIIHILSTQYTNAIEGEGVYEPYFPPIGNLVASFTWLSKLNRVRGCSRQLGYNYNMHTTVTCTTVPGAL